MNTTFPRVHVADMPDLCVRWNVCSDDEDCLYLLTDRLALCHVLCGIRFLLGVIDRADLTHSMPPRLVAREGRKVVERAQCPLAVQVQELVETVGGVVLVS